MYRYRLLRYRLVLHYR